MCFAIDGELKLNIQIV